MVSVGPNASSGSKAGKTMSAKCRGTCSEVVDRWSVRLSVAVGGVDLGGVD